MQYFAEKTARSLKKKGRSLNIFAQTAAMPYLCNEKKTYIYT